MCVLERTNEDCVGILFEISKQIPEGQYVKLCKNLKVMYESGKTIRSDVDETFALLRREVKKRNEVIGRMARTIDSSRKALKMSKGKFKQTGVAKLLGDKDRYFLTQEDDTMIHSKGWCLSPTSDVRARLSAIDE
tara:strand:+ start:438 stop:842 length:405 start_codon:yes stop_codon:yes gene_type:complete